MVKYSNLFSIDLVIYSSIFWAARLFTPSLLILEQATMHFAHFTVANPGVKY